MVPYTRFVPLLERTANSFALDLEPSPSLDGLLKTNRNLYFLKLGLTRPKFMKVAFFILFRKNPELNLGLHSASPRLSRRAKTRGHDQKATIR